jgi:putative ABC transport system ATP-binding protein
LKNRGVDMVIKTPVDENSVPSGPILKVEAQNSALEDKLPPKESHIVSDEIVNEEPIEFKLCNTGNMQNNVEKSHKTGTPVIEVVNVKKSYTLGEIEVPILHDINLEVQEGEFLAIMGPSGSGKSTLMNLIGFLDRPTEGRIMIKGLDINKLTDREIARLRGLEIGFVFQVFNLIPRLTALENVELPTYANARSGVDAHKRAKDLLKLVGLQDRMHHRPGELSGGQSQRVAIARALINDPAILLADEPTGNLDSRTGNEILNMFTGLNKDGRTIVMITHDPEIARFADRVVFVKDGIIQNSPNT